MKSTAISAIWTEKFHHLTSIWALYDLGTTVDSGDTVAKETKSLSSWCLHVNKRDKINTQIKTILPGNDKHCEETKQGKGVTARTRLFWLARQEELLWEGNIWADIRMEDGIWAKKQRACTKAFMLGVSKEQWQGQCHWAEWARGRGYEMRWMRWAGACLCRVLQAVVWRLDFILNVREGLEGRALKQFDLLKDLSGCWAESHWKGGQLGGTHGGPGMVAWVDVTVVRRKQRILILKAGHTGFAYKRRSCEGKEKSRN